MIKVTIYTDTQTGHGYIDRQTEVAWWELDLNFQSVDFNKPIDYRGGSYMVVSIVGDRVTNEIVSMAVVKVGRSTVAKRIAFKR